MKDTEISWCDDTINPWWGCAKVSPACVNCYAETLSTRFHPAATPKDEPARALHWGPQAPRLLRVEKAIGELERSARRAVKEGVKRRVFIASMADIFEDRSDLVEPRRAFLGALDRIQRDMGNHLDVSRSSPPLIPLLLTKRPEVALEYARANLWPAGAWLGVTVEDQQRADERIPVALEVAALTGCQVFLSMEPLLGAVDISKWLGYNPSYATDEQGREGLRSCGGWLVRYPVRRIDLEGASTQAEPVAGLSEGEGHRASPDRRSGGGRLSDRQGDGGSGSGLRAGTQAGLAPLHGPDPTRPDHQPQERRQGRQPAGEPGVGNLFGAGPAREQGAGHGGRLQSVRGEEPRSEADRVAGAGNPQAPQGRGEVDGSGRGFRHESTGHLEDRAAEAVGVQYVIVGGESGHGARPMHAEWARSLRDQCQQAGVPFHFKQWGEWAPSSVSLWVDGGGCEREADFSRWHEPGKSGAISVFRFGKHAAGRVLDGRTHDDVPR